MVTTEGNIAPTRGKWGSRIGFILAAAGSAVGLGNIWRFPYVAGENGGGLFILVYIICVVALGLPIMLVEFSIGRSTQRSPVGAFKKLKPNTPWFMVGGFGVLAGFLILSFYGVVAGWTLGYVVESIRGALTGASAEQITQHFDNFTGNPLITIGYFVGIMLLTMFIVSRGIKSGIERWSKILMPALFIMLLLVIARSITLPGSSEGLKFIFWPNFDKFNPDIMMKALGQAFFSMSLGMGAMLTYGSYLRKKENMPSATLLVGGLDLLVAILAGIALFPALLAMGFSPEQGTGLAFKTFPIIFNQIPLGTIIMPIFFILLVVAALTSTISLLEVISSYFIDEKGWGRKKAAGFMGFVVMLVGIPSALATKTGLLSPEKLGFDLSALVGHIAADYMLPIGAFAMSVFVGFAWKKGALKEAREGSSGFAAAPVWLFIVRWIAPFIIGQIILLGFLSEFESLKKLLDKLSTILSIVDAVIIGLLVIGAVIYLIVRKTGGGGDDKLQQEN